MCICICLCGGCIGAVPLLGAVGSRRDVTHTVVQVQFVITICIIISFFGKTIVIIFCFVNGHCVAEMMMMVVVVMILILDENYVSLFKREMLICELPF